MNTVDWIAHSPCWMAAAVRAFANYGLSLSGIPGLVPVDIEPARLVCPVAPRPQAAGRDGAIRR